MTSSPTAKPRPLSPHLGIYKPQVSSVMSILHRATGVGLSLALPVLVIWIFMMAGGKDTYALFTEHFQPVLGMATAFIAIALAIGCIFCFVNKLIQKSKPSGFVRFILGLIDTVAAIGLTYTLFSLSLDFLPAELNIVFTYLGVIVLVGWSWSFFYHFCCGLRHLAWDAGWGIDLPAMRATGWLCVGLSLAATAGLWLKIWGYVP